MESKESILNRWFLYKDPKDLSLLEALGKVSEGKLLAKILQNLPKEQLLLICRTSKYIKSICDKYELIDRLYAGELYIFGSGITIPKKIFSNVIQVAFGYKYLAFITTENELYLCKSSSDFEPIKVNNIPKVKHVSVGSNLFISHHVLAVTINNDLYFINGDILMSKKIELNNSKVKEARTNHYVFPFITCIEDNGDLREYNFATSLGAVLFKNVKQLSRNQSFVSKEGYYYFNDFDKPSRSYKVKEICAGYLKDKYGDSTDTKHIKAIITNYDDFRIGYDTKNNDTDFKLIAKNVLTADCGTENYTFVTKDGKLYTFGTGQLGNMGDGILKEHTIDEPFEVKNIPKVSQVSCGIDCTAFITNSEFKFDINCQICGSVAKYHTDKHLFCGKECFNEFYSFDK